MATLRATLRATLLASVMATLLVAGCGAPARLSVADGTGTHPVIPAPRTSLIPTINVVTAKPWRANETPVAAEGTTVNAFATGLDHPRWLYPLPNGDVLVAETNAPARPDDARGIRGWFFKRYQKKAGGATASANRITLLRDADGDGVAELRAVLLSGLNSPFGMALIDDRMYVANTEAIRSFPYVVGQTRISAPGVKVIDLPGGPLNHHWTKNLIASPDGTRLYVAVGSNSNAAENGIDREWERAAIWEVDPTSGEHRIHASGLRNPVGMAWEPHSGALWVAVNERDELGGDLVPDYMTAVQRGAFYGWPYSYFGPHIDTRVTPERPDLVATAIVPDYALGPHTASLGLASSAHNRLPVRFADGMFVGQHGSWNRRPLSGYKVVFVPFANGRPSGAPIDVLTGFVNSSGEAHGRPVGVAIDGRGALLVADDVGNIIWRVVGIGTARANTLPVR